MKTLPDRVGLLGDVHCQDAALDAALALFRGQGAGAILCVGDVVDGPGDVERTRTLLEDAQVEAVSGNHERWLLAGELRDLRDATPTAQVTPALRTWLESLPPTREYQTSAGILLLCHGVGDDDMALLRSWDAGYALETNDALQRLLASQRYQVVIGGHTHARMVRKLDGLTFVNPGTLLPGDQPCVAVLDFAAREVRFFDWDGARFTPGTQVPW